MYTRKLFSFFIVLLLNVGLKAQSSAQLLESITRVNDKWQAQHSPYVRAFWDHAAYFTGNMEVYRLTGKADYYQYSDRWCRYNKWMGAQGADIKQWKYKTYGEGHDFVLFADWQICFQTYIDMYNLVPAEFKVERAKEVMSHMANMPETDFWWWSDALYMAMPLMTKMYKLTGDVKYLDKLYECYAWSDSLMWDAESQLYYRDGKYIWPKVKTSCDGGKSFWARGDGWVLAGLAKVLADMPQDYKHRAFFVQRFRQLSEGVKRCQRPQGYWSRSMLCEDDAPGPETSGTAFFTYGILCGVNNGLLSKSDYETTIEKAWDYLYNVALQDDHTIGFVQPIGEKPDPNKVVDAHSQAPFGTGAWLLAACERVRYQENAKLRTSLQIQVTNPTDVNRCDVISLDAKQIFEKLDLPVARVVTVSDGDRVSIPYQLTYDGKFLIQAFVRPGQTNTYTIAYNPYPKDYRLDANGRIYPNREDDVSFENDKCGWRLYGPKMHNKGVTGFDVFCKNVTYPIVDQLYQNELASYALNEKLKKEGRGAMWPMIHRNEFTYHRDRGQGMDAYTVGKTLGAGAPALLVDGALKVSDVYRTAAILDNGPLRFTVSMLMHEHDGIQETRVITLDRGMHLAKCEATFWGASRGSTAVAGIIVHDSNTNFLLDKKNGFIAYADAMDTPQGQNGELYLACLFPGAKTKLTFDKQTKHIMGLQTLGSDNCFTYYVGSAWSKYDIPNFQIWQTLLAQYRQQFLNPMKVDVKVLKPVGRQ